MKLQAQSFENAEVKYNSNPLIGIDASSIMKRVMNVEGRYSGVIELNKRPFCASRILIGPRGDIPKYEISFPTMSYHSMFGSFCNQLHLQIKDLRQTHRCIGIIRKQFIDCVVDYCSNATVYYVEFPRSATPMDKMLILSAV